MNADPEWLKNEYSGSWAKHAANVLRLKDQLIATYPKLEGCIREGHGATSGEWLRFPPHSRSEADLTLFCDYNPLCHIEVTGSDKPSAFVPPGKFWVRLDKLDFAVEEEKEGVTYFFWLQYPNAAYVLTVPLVQKYRHTLIEREIHPGKPETYIEVPWQEGLSPSYLFTWIGDYLKERGKNGD